MTNNILNKSIKNCNILFLHHSTGYLIYHGGNPPNMIKRKLFPNKSFVSNWFCNYNKDNNTNYKITNRFFPKSTPYGWKNYPYDYYNIWVKNGGNNPYLNEPTLEILTKQYDLIIFKHCYPVSNIEDDINIPEIDSPEKRIENYKLQYLALQKKLHEFPNTKFLIWTGAIQVKNSLTYKQSLNAKNFFEWVLNDWGASNDNIYIWDYYSLATEGDLYLKDDHAKNIYDSHPRNSFEQKIAPMF